MKNLGSVDNSNAENIGLSGRIRATVIPVKDGRELTLTELLTAKYSLSGVQKILSGDMQSEPFLSGSSACSLSSLF